MIDGAAVAAAARTWVGTPYLHQARGPKGPDGGTDCVGLLIGVAKELGIIQGDYDPTGYDWETDGTQLAEELAKWADLQIVTDDPFPLSFWEERLQEGDILVFKVVGLPQHTSFVTKIDYGGGVVVPGMIHAYNPQEKVIEHRIDDRWAGRLIQQWRLRG